MNLPNSENFEIKNQHFNLINLIFCIVFSVLFAVGFAIRMFIDSSAEPIEWCIMIVPAVLLLITVLAIIIDRRITFTFKDGVFTYKKPLRKAKSVSAEDISCVNIFKSVKDFNDVVFIDKSGKKVLAFTDDGTVIICKAFTDTLNRLNIPINYF